MSAIRLQHAYQCIAISLPQTCCYTLIRHSMREVARLVFPLEGVDHFALLSSLYPLDSQFSLDLQGLSPFLPEAANASCNSDIAKREL